MVGIGSVDTKQPPRRGHPSRATTLALTLLHHPDPARAGDVARFDACVDLSRETPSFTAPGCREARPIADRVVSRTPVTISAADDGARIDNPAGLALVVDGEGVDRSASFDRAAIERGLVIELSDRVVLLLHRVVTADEHGPDLGLVGSNDAIEELRRHVLRVADLPVPVLIRGESGTGKDLIARAVHAASLRAQGPFVAVNMAAIPASTAASELFGHVRGAFTGAATDHAGYFGRANGGSLFLDEIGATPSDVQPMLLRALESSEIQPLGTATPRRVDARLIAATDADLERAIFNDSFRAALLHRLEGYQLFVPPLRRRRDDLGRLLVHFARAELDVVGEVDKLAPAGPDEPTWLPADFVARLVRLDWPGNVRQLKNVVRQLVISSRGARELVVDAALTRLLDAAVAPQSQPALAEAPPSEITDEAMIGALRAAGWQVNRAAAVLCVSRSYLYGRIKSCAAIRKPEDIEAEEIVASRDACGGDLAEAARRLEISKRALIRRMRELGVE